MPTVSVVMAVYNGSRHLRAAIESTLRQTYGDFEFIIIDDGSTDHSRDIVASYADGRIRLLTNERNRGLTPSLNLGLAASTGELVARQDADDISEPERLARQIAYLERQRNIAVLGTWYTKIDVDGRPIGERRLPCAPVDIRWAMLFHCPLIHSAVMFRRSALAATTGFYDEAFVYAQDYDLWSRAARRLLLANLDERLVRLRINPASMTATYGERTLEGPRISLRNIAALLGTDEAPSGYDQLLAPIQALVLGAGSDAPAEKLTATVPVVFRLHDAFTRVEGLDANAARGRRRALAAGMAVRLLGLANDRARRHLPGAWTLAATAWRLRPQSVVSRHAARAARAILEG
jgi:Glycosyl transferase family 2